MYNIIQKLSSVFTENTQESRFKYHYVIMWLFFGIINFYFNSFYIYDIITSAIKIQYKLHAILAIFSHTALQTVLIAAIIFLLFYKSAKKPVITIALSIVSIVIIIIVTNIDLIVFSLYKFHINYFVITEFIQPDYFKSAGISPSAIAIEILYYFIAAIILTLVALFCFLIPLNKLYKIHLNKIIIYFVILTVIIEKLFLTVNAVTRPQYIYDLPKRIPFIYINSPVHLYNQIFSKLGFQDEREEFNELLGDDKHIIYPLKEPYKQFSESYNIILIILESTRSYTYTSQVAPQVYKYAQQYGFIKLNHYSSSNSTHMGVFPIFYSLNPYYSSYIKTTKKASFPMEIFKANHYNRYFFYSSSLNWHKMGNFINQNFDFIITLTQKDEYVRDAYLTSSVLQVLSKQKSNSRFFLSIFYTSSHYPFSFDKSKAAFTPYLTEPFDKNNFIFIDNNKNKLFNSYRNSIAYLDNEVGKILHYIYSSPYKHNTIILITSDHGCEFGETGRYFYSSDLNNYQTMVPLVIIVPSRLYHKYNSINWQQHLSSHLDIMPTLFDMCGYPGSIQNMQGTSIYNKTNNNYIIVGFQDVYKPSKYAVCDATHKIIINFNHPKLIERQLTINDEPTSTTVDTSPFVTYLIDSINYFNTARKIQK